MQPIVAVIAPGMMGSAVGQRLVENGIEVRTALGGRARAPLHVPRLPGMIGVSGWEAGGLRYHTVDRAARRRARAGRATCACNARRPEEADLR